MQNKNQKRTAFNSQIFNNIRIFNNKNKNFNNYLHS
jgi:hypothetical protein